MNYRIVIDIEKSGKKHFYVSKRWFGFIWMYFTQIRDVSFNEYKIEYASLEAAEEAIQQDVNAKYEKDQRKIVRREIFER